MAVTALIVPVSGPYTGFWNAFSLGTQNDDGFVLRGTYQGQEVNQSDAYGMTLMEAIWRGLNWRMRFRGLEFNKTGMLGAIHAFGSGPGASPVTTFTPILTAIGDRFSKYAQTLLLNSILGAYPPTMPNTLTANGAIVAPQNDVEYLMTSKVREAPFEMVLLPYSTTIYGSAQVISFSTT